MEGNNTTTMQLVQAVADDKLDYPVFPIRRAGLERMKDGVSSKERKKMGRLMAMCAGVQGNSRSEGITAVEPVTSVFRRPRSGPAEIGN
jgi:hypothetical protein